MGCSIPASPGGVQVSTKGGAPGYSRRHYQALADMGSRQTDDGRGQERIVCRKAGEQAHTEMLERFAPLTAENAPEAIRWQAARILELQK